MGVSSDVKPSNVLINTQGQVKMCDFGISGHLVDSVAKTMDAGCKPYMAVSTPRRTAPGSRVTPELRSLEAQPQPRVQPSPWSRVSQTTPSVKFNTHTHTHQVNTHTSGELKAAPCHAFDCRYLFIYRLQIDELDCSSGIKKTNRLRVFQRQLWLRGVSE